jgi:hypothetical protein
MIELRWRKDERWVGGIIIQTSIDLLLEYRQQIDGEWSEWERVPHVALPAELENE